MRRLLQEDMIPALWIAFALYWVLAAVRQRRAKQDESLMARLFYVVLAGIALLFLLDKKDSIAALWFLLASMPRSLFYGSGARNNANRFSRGCLTWER